MKGGLRQSCTRVLPGGPYRDPGEAGILGSGDRPPLLLHNLSSRDLKRQGLPGVPDIPHHYLGGKSPIPRVVDANRVGALIKHQWLA